MTALHTEEYRRFAAALARARDAAGLSQRQLALKLGKTQSYVAKYETARQRLDVVEFLQVIRAIGVDPMTILVAVSLSTLPPTSE